MLGNEQSDVTRELARILQSDSFRQSRRMSDLLRFLVTEALTGSQDSLKESVIAVEVFGRDPAFNPKSDPIVRNEMRRLRAKLLECYASRIEPAELTIEIPKGRYAPLFRRAEEIRC